MNFAPRRSTPHYSGKRIHSGEYMAGGGHIPPLYARNTLPGPGILRPEPFGLAMGDPIGSRPLDLLPPPEFMERKLATQHAEIQRLASENQRLAATHVALRQELVAAQQELQRLQTHMEAVQTDKEQQLRSGLDKIAKMEVDIRAAESLKVELQHARTDAQSLISIRQDLTTQVQQLTQELQRAHAEVQQVPAMRTEIDSLRQELQRARTAFEYEKASSSEQVEQIQAMEKNLVSMAREVEKLRAELTNASDKRGRAVPYGGAYNGPDAHYPSVGQNIYGDSYGMSQMPAAPENVVAYPTGAASGWGGYDIARVSGSHIRR